MSNARNIMHKITACVLSIVMLASCAQVKDIAYFQDKAIDHPEQIDKHGGIVIQPKDMISIVVSPPCHQLSGRFGSRHKHYTAKAHGLCG